MTNRRKQGIRRLLRTTPLFYSRIVAWLLVSAMTLLCVPPAMAAPVTRHAISLASGRLTLASQRLELNLVETLLSLPARGPIGFLLGGWALSFKNPSSLSQGPNENRGVRIRQETRNEKETRVATLKINPGGNVKLQSRQAMLFTAVPTDAEGNSIHGLQATWTSSNKQVVFVDRIGQAMGIKPGRATLTATAGTMTSDVNVVVVENRSRDRFGGKKPTSTRGHAQSMANDLDKNLTESRSAGARATTPNKASRKSRLKHHEAVNNALPIPQRPPTEDPLPDDETYSLYQPGNLVGAPPGKTKGGAGPRSVPKLLGLENGSQNFNFALPIVGLAGRGPDVSLSLIYNSQVWNKSVAPGDSSTWMTFDVDSGWTGPGFRMGFGQIEDQGSAGFTLTDMDGTRHALVYSSVNNFDTNDGTFIHYSGGSTSGTLYYPDGTMVTYGAGGGGFRIYPIKITDRNGNFIEISYAGTNGAGPRIATIQDTLSRYINFWYASNGDLIAITAPGLGTTDLQMMRFYYTDVTLGSNLFDFSTNVNGPTSAHTLQYVYLPASSDGTDPHIGYKFEYSPYGMVREIKQFRGMTVSSLSTTSAGSVTGDGTMAAQTIYGYPTSGQSLSDVPKYSTRTDEWAGRTTSGSAPAYSFANSSATGEKISTVTAPDNTVSETHTIDNPGNWDDGLVKQSLIKYGSTVLSSTVIEWEQTPTNGPPRVASVRTTDDGSTARTKATVFSYTSYNNVSVVSERDFTTDGTVSSTELRRTETTYVTSSGYINRRLLSLPSSVQVFPGGSSTPASRIDYAYDNYGTNHANLTARDDIIRHDPAFDPFQPPQESCHWGECIEYYDGQCIAWDWVCDSIPVYDSSTDYRGNVTSVTTYPDASTTSGAITHSTTYDIAGNVTTAQVDCCQLKSFTYSGAGDEGDYAFVESVTSGDSGGLHLTTSAQYYFNTGLVDTTTDENGQTTTNYYNSDSLRLEHTIYPDGGATYLTYGDALTYGRYNVGVSTKLDGSGSSTRYVNSYFHYDGRGGLARTFTNPTTADGWVTQDTQYDNMGRAYRASNPYYSTGVDSSVNPDGYWTMNSFDHLGRLTTVTMPRGDNDNSLTTSVQTSFDGIYTTVTDQAGKVRRQKVDALGRLVRLDEPTTSGLGTVSSPYQATDYYYDTVDNLVRINQGSQNRYFKYDSLSRLIRERQVEQDTNSSYDLSDSLTGNSSWSRKLVYNSSGLMTDAYDARGVQTTFSYDDLNRVTAISYSDSTPAAHYYYDSQSLPSGAPSYTHSNTTGRLLAMTYGSSSSITGNYFAYDVMGRVTTQKQVTGSTVYGLSYAYNYAGMLTGETYPSSRALSYSYDEGGRLSAMGDGTTTFASSFQYAGHGGLKSETFGNGMVHALEYNRRLQESRVKLSQTVSSVTTVLQQYDYGYGEFNTTSGAVDTSKNNGQIGKIEATIGTAAQWNQGFSYDELGRLSNVVEHAASGMTTPANYSQDYTYDRYGNRFQSANATLGLPAVSSSEINAATNRFITTGSTPTTYDAAGNITNDTKFRNLKYVYDANGRQTAAKLQNDTTIQSSVYDCAGQRVQTTAGSMTRTMVYDVFGQDVADYLGSSGSTLERENIYRGGQLLATDESLNAAAPSALASTPSSSNVALSWTAASGASKYRVERKSAGGSYGLLTTTTSTSYTDSGATSGNAYLYRVCAADSANNCTSDYSNIVLGASLNFSTDSTITGYSENSSSATSIKAAHITELRTAINAVRSLAGQSAASYTHSSLAAGDVVYADDVRELRTKLAEALSALAIQSSSYTDSTIVSFSEDPMNATTIKAVHIRELRQRATSGAGTSSSGSTSGGLHYFLTDIQGSTRAVMNNNGTSSAIVARHDYLPFGEEIGSTIGSRSNTPGYAAADANRRKYALLERDDATGLDHTWWRKYENLSGRWTSPDPVTGQLGDPQGFNRYSYVQNDPVNFGDPDGLFPVFTIYLLALMWQMNNGSWIVNGLPPEFSPLNNGSSHGERGTLEEVDSESGERGKGAGGGDSPQPAKTLPFNSCDEFVDYLARLAINTARGVSRNPLALGATMVSLAALGTRMMYTARFEYDSYGNNGFSGFKEELTAGGQNQGVYSHVLGMAGATIVGGPGDTIAAANHIKDVWQTYRGNDRQRREGPAELAGNMAGISVGGNMVGYIAGVRDEKKLRNSLKSILCKPGS